LSDGQPKLAIRFVDKQGYTAGEALLNITTQRFATLLILINFLRFSLPCLLRALYWLPAWLFFMDVSVDGEHKHFSIYVPAFVCFKCLF
jgi:hypothetical protein